LRADDIDQRRARDVRVLERIEQRRGGALALDRAQATAATGGRCVGEPCRIAAVLGVGERRSTSTKAIVSRLSAEPSASARSDRVALEADQLFDDLARPAATRVRRWS